MIDWPAAIAAATIWIYWSCVAALVVRSHLRFRTAAGGVPRTARERWMWLVWGPTILLWLMLPLRACVSGLAAAAWPGVGLVFAIRCLASGVGVAALLLTIPCWLGMGRDWSMAIVPNKRTRLITTGMFRRVRHPIYALSLLLMAATIVAVPTVGMILIGAVHGTMLYQKAVSEERFLHRLHGNRYAEYARRTNRFLPRLFAPRTGRNEQSVQRCRHAA